MVVVAAIAVGITSRAAATKDGLIIVVAHEDITVVCVDPVAVSNRVQCVILVLSTTEGALTATYLNIKMVLMVVNI